MIRKMKRIFLGIGIGSIGLWMTGCTDETAQEPDNIYNTYMASGMKEAPAADYLAAPGGNVPADLIKYVSELSCANFIWNNYQYTDLTEKFLYCPMGRMPE